MEDLIDGMKNLLKDQVLIQVDETNLTISLNFKGEKKTKDELGEENEVKDMLKIFGGLTKEIYMDIDIDDKSQKINIKFKNKEDMAKVHEILENLWERAVSILKKAIAGDFMAIKDLGDFSG